MMYQLFGNQTRGWLMALGLSCTVLNSAMAETLTLGEAERLALEDDHTLRAISARSESMSELSAASKSYPDPKLKLGFANVPTDSFNLGQEAMTQTVIGVRQEFPRGQTRALNSARIGKSIARNEAKAEDRRRQILLAVREDYIQVFLHLERQKILQQSLIVFSDLAEITRDYYATGRAHQQDVVQARLELAKVEERLARIRQQEEETRAGLAERIGNHSLRDLGPTWPELTQPVAPNKIIENLPDHPRMRAWRHEIARAETTEEIARQSYKPGFAVDLAYGGRSGQNVDGSDRSDLLTVFVTMDIPLFTKNRQDRLLASSIAETSAIRFARDDVYRSMKAGADQLFATMNRERERLALYEEHLLPQASFNAEAAYEAYQDAVGDLATLLRARIGEYEIRLGHADLRADEIITRARLLYLQGETS